jgi:hypothetical protein
MQYRFDFLVIFWSGIAYIESYTTLQREHGSVTQVAKRSARQPRLVETVANQLLDFSR